jgi:cyclophilin family peptidyl-prolyl cis-trans isomerase
VVRGLLAGLLFAVACSDKAPPPAKVVAGPPPDSFHVAFETSRGKFVVAIDRKLSPHGVDRFRELVDSQFFDDERFYRAVPKFVVQWGLHDKPAVNEAWDSKRILDDSVRTSNVRGTIAFAMEGKNTRTHQLFISLKDNSRLDKLGFSPIGRVVEGMDVVDSLYSGYGDTPDAHFIQTMGNSYLTRMFPKLDFIKTARRTP